MDVFIEKIVKRKKTSGDYMFIGGLISAGVLLGLLILTIPILNYFAPLLYAGIIFLIYFMASSRKVEFEYSFTSGELDVDFIVAKKKRRRAFSANCKEFDIVAKYDSDKYENATRNARKHFVMVSTLSSPDVYFAVLNYNGERTVILFEPGERMLEAIRKCIPSKVFI